LRKGTINRLKPSGVLQAAAGKFGCVTLGASLLLVMLICLPRPGWSGDETGLWRALASGGHVALIRHALAPGFGDPENFRVDDCTTQRNLSEAGRRQARDIGRRFRDNGVEDVRVYSSQWCRCLDTARLLGLGEVIVFAGLNSFFQDRTREAARTAEVKELIRIHAGGISLVLVTHQVNITALTGVFPQSGEIVILRPVGNDFEVLGSIR
jgi:phosphohistidine phosphatase SixA